MDNEYILSLRLRFQREGLNNDAIDAAILSELQRNFDAHPPSLNRELHKDSIKVPPKAVRGAGKKQPKKIQASSPNRTEQPQMYALFHSDEEKERAKLRAQREGKK